MADLVTNLERRYLPFKKRKRKGGCDCNCDCCTFECIQPEYYDESPLLEVLKEKLFEIFE